MRVTLKNGVVLEFDSTGMVEDFKECARMAKIARHVNAM